MKKNIHLIKEALCFTPVVTPLDDTLNQNWFKVGLAILSHSRFYYLAGFFCLLSLSAVSQMTVTSVTSGGWNTKTTWDCGCVPASIDNVVIASGTKVTLNAATSINDLVIKSGSILYNNNKQLTVSGNYTVDGDHVNMSGVFTVSTGMTILSGNNTSIDGVGTIHESELSLTGGNKTILATANITKAFGVISINNITVSNLGTVTVGGSITGAGPNSIWTNEANSTLNIRGELINNGVLEASAVGNTIRYYGKAAQDIKTSSGNIYHHMILESSGIKNLISDVTINGDLYLNSGTFNANSYLINLKGHWVNQGVFQESTSTVMFSGNANQILKCISPQRFYNLTIDKAGGKVSLGCSDTVTNRLSMNNGNIDVGSGKLILGTGLSNEGSLIYSAGHIIGKFERWINTGFTPFEFPIGTDANLRAAALTMSAYTGGSLIVEFVEIAPGSNGLPLLDVSDSIRNTFIEGYWEITAANSFSTTNYQVGFAGDGFNSFTIDSSTRVLSRLSISDPWTVNGVHNPAIGTNAFRTGMNTIGQYAFGDTSNCPVPITSPITGADSICINTNGSIYSVIDSVGSTYTWTVTGGTIASGQGANSISVNWGNMGMEGSVEVVENNGCTDGITMSKTVSIHPFTTSAITGKENVSENTTGEIYSITGTPGYTYIWSVQQGTIALGQGTSVVTIDWGASGTAKVSVIGSNGCGTADTVHLDVNLYVPINSVKSGKWNDVSTWNCKCVPLSSNNVRIMNKHKVELKGSTTINHFEIVAGGELDASGENMEVQGDITIDGEYSGDGSLTLSGSGTIIDGIGKITGKGDLNIQDGNKSILTSAYLTKEKKDIVIKDAYIVTNYGNFLHYDDIVGTDPNSTWINETNSTLIIEGDLLNMGRLITSASGNIVDYTGSNAQNVKKPDGNVYYNLTVDKTNQDLQLTDHITTTELSLNSGNVVLGDYNLTIKEQGVVYSADTGSYIVADGSGAMVKLFDVAGTFDFPIGDSLNYTPISLTLNSAQFFGSDNITMKIKDAKHPNMSGSDYITRYWSMTWSGLLNINFDVNYNYTQNDVVGTETSMVTNIWDGSSWTIHEPVNDITNTFLTSSGISVPFPGILDFTGGSGGALPVNLINFDAKVNGQVVDISWSTANEVNNDHFVVERSSDGITFNTIEIVDGAGNNYSVHDYTITDASPLSGLSYYRLLQLDINGKSTYSDIVSVIFNKKTTPGVKIYPNPIVDGKFYFVTWGSESKEVLVVLLDHLGREVFTKMVLLPENGGILEGIDIGSKLPSGVYFVVASSDDFLFKQKVVVSNYEPIENQ